ncbi:Flp pilus assembly protein CpaB [Photobacterium phosphoreum]|nr:Flp pilus assembly protein CpaB [Photobacterium phosphoreum]
MSSALGLALVVLAAAILACGARAMYISSQQVQAPSDPEVRIRVTASNLPAGLLLRDSDLEWQSVPKSKVPKSSITEGVDLDIASGALLRNALNAGVVIKRTDVISSDSPGFLAAVLKPGMRAVSVPVNDVSGNAGLIQPGDYVDMILTQ